MQSIQRLREPKLPSLRLRAQTGRAVDREQATTAIGQLAKGAATRRCSDDGPAGSPPQWGQKGNLKAERWLVDEERAVFSEWHKLEASEGGKPGTRSRGDYVITKDQFYTHWLSVKDTLERNPDLPNFPDRGGSGAYYQRVNRLKRSGWQWDGDGITMNPPTAPSVKVVNRTEKRAKRVLHRGRETIPIRDAEVDLRSPDRDETLGTSGVTEISVNELATETMDMPVEPSDSDAGDQPTPTRVPNVANSKRTIGNQSEDNGGSIEQNTLEGEISSMQEKFWSLFARNRKAPVRRPALKINPAKVKPALWSALDSCIAKALKRNCKCRDKLRTLNAAVYSAGQVLAAQDRDRRDAARVRSMEWLKAQRLELGNLRRHIGWITDELSRRKSGARPTPRQRKNFTELQHRYQVCGKPIRCTRDLEAKRERLLTHLHVVKSRIEYRLDREQRAVKRAKPLRQRLEEPAGDTNLEPDQARKFWAKIIGERREFTEQPELARWRKKISDKVPNTQSFANNAADLVVWKKVLGKARPLKAPGPDGIPNLLWKKFGSANEALFKWLMGIKRKQLRVPPWLAEGRVVLLPKGGATDDPSNYRPIACLNTMYKLVTGMMTAWITDHLTQHEILPEEQRAMVKGTWGCTHAMVLDRAVTSHSKAINVPLHVAWIDFEKAFDSVSQPWLRVALKAVKLHPRIRQLLEALMQCWVVRYEVVRNGKVCKSDKLEVKNGLLQGDTLSPMLYCLSVAAISDAINELPRVEVVVPGQGVLLKINHLLFIDDLKGFARKRRYLDRLVELLRRIAGAIGLRINAKKSAIASTRDADHEQPEDQLLPTLGVRESYKYLGVEERIGVSFGDAWERVKTKMTARLKSVLQSESTFGEIRTAVRTVVVPVAKYIFLNVVAGGPSWTDLKYCASRFDKDIRDMLTETTNGSCSWRLKSNCRARLYLEPRLGGLGLPSMEDALTESLVYCWSYIQCKPELEVARQLFGSISKSGVTESISKGLRRLVLKPFGLFDESTQQVTVPRDQSRGFFIGETFYGDPTPGARALMKVVRARRNQMRLTEWKGLQQAGSIALNPDIDQELSFHWLKKANVGRKAFRDCIATQEGRLLAAEIFSNKLTMEGRKCRRCQAGMETEQHILTGCSWSRTGLMLARHDGVVRQIHTALCRKFDLPVLHHTLPLHAVTENAKAKIFHDVPLFTKGVRSLTMNDGSVQCEGIRSNRPDLVVFDKNSCKIHVIEVSVPWRENLKTQELIKWRKYAMNSEIEPLVLASKEVPGPNLRAQLGEQYGADFPGGVTVTPIVVGACGEVLPSAMDRLKEIGIKEKSAKLKLLESMQRAAVTGSSRVIRAHLCLPRHRK